MATCKNRCAIHPYRISRHLLTEAACVQEIVKASLEKSKEAISHAELEVGKQLEDLRQIELQLKSHEAKEDHAAARQAEDKAVAIQHDVQVTVNTAQLKISQASLMSSGGR